MNKKKQLEQWTTLVADTGDIEAIREHQSQDATTNPSLLLATAEDHQYAYLLRQARALSMDLCSQPDTTLLATAFAAVTGQSILETVPGLVSTEVDARLSFDTCASIEKARQLIYLYRQLGIQQERILIKIAGTWEGIRAAEVLEQEGIHCNITLIFGLHQARAAAEAGATLISPFVGRIHDWHLKHGGTIHTIQDDPGVQSVQQIYQYYKSHDLDTIVMGASFRNQQQIEALAGCDRLTISPKLLAQLSEDNAPLERQLSHEQIPLQAEQAPISETEFRYQLNQDAMANDLLSDGIRRFILDQEKLEILLQKQL